jgi:competence ComEA-like helix-hairpin-helix protein
MIPVYRWVKNFFGFSRAQTNAFILLLPLMGIAIFSEPLYRRWISRRSDDFSADQAKLDSLVALLEIKKRKEQPIDSSSFHRTVIKPVLFVFDPNHATPEELQSLGFPKSLATRIAHYREKGGKFRVKRDLLKIYGMDSAFYRQVSPFIRLPEESKKEERITRKAVSKVKETMIRFDLNEADTAQLKKIYGIGEKLSLRIIRYRDGLGGFISARQLEEVYGLDTVVVNRLLKVSFVAEDFQPRRINVNTADEKELSAHPYLPKNAAKAIVAYRFQHGEFNSLSDLEKIQSVGAKTFQKIAPYLKLND